MTCGQGGLPAPFPLSHAIVALWTQKARDCGAVSLLEPLPLSAQHLAVNKFKRPRCKDSNKRVGGRSNMRGCSRQT